MIVIIKELFTLTTAPLGVVSRRDCGCINDDEGHKHAARTVFTAATEHIEAETNGRHFADDVLKSIFLNENEWISIKISLKFVPKS